MSDIVQSIDEQDVTQLFDKFGILKGNMTLKVQLLVKRSKEVPNPYRKGEMQTEWESISDIDVTVESDLAVKIEKAVHKILSEDLE